MTQLLGWGKGIVLSFFVPALHGSCLSSPFLVLVILVTGNNFCGPVCTLPPSQNVDIDKLAYPLHLQSKPIFCQSDTEGNLSKQLVHQDVHFSNPSFILSGPNWFRFGGDPATTTEVEASS